MYLLLVLEGFGDCRAREYTGWSHLYLGLHCVQHQDPDHDAAAAIEVTGNKHRWQLAPPVTCSLIPGMFP